jgi:putative MATE family efflux protein
VAVAFPAGILRLIGASPDVVAQGYQFFRIILLTLPIALFSGVIVGVLRSLGDSRTPMLITMAAVVSNTLLSVALVFGMGPFPTLGVEGAAIATCISQILRACLLSYFLLVRQRFVKIRLVDLWKFDWRMTRALLSLAYPMLLTDVFWGIGNFTYALLYVRLGTAAVAATQMINSTLGVVNTLPTGLAIAALILVGQAVGTRDPTIITTNSREIRKLGLYASLLLSLVFVVICLTLRTFYPNVSQETIDGATYGLLLNALFYPAMVTNLVVGSGVLRGGGDTRFTLVASLTSIYAVGLPATFVLAFVLKLGLWGVFLGKGMEEISRAVMLLARCRTSRWYRASTS